MSDYYKGAKRMVKNGVPVRVAAWVKDLSPRSKAEMLQHDAGPIMKPYGSRYLNKSWFRSEADV